jgi:hypothetical protein
MLRSDKKLISTALSCAVLAVFAGCGSSNNNNSSAPAAAATPAANPAPAAATGASLQCTSSGKNAWLTYGQTAFVAVNESIFTNVVNVGATTSTTTPLGTPFTLVGSGNPPSTADNLATFKGNLAAFLVYLYGGPTQITYTDGVVYQGPQNMQQSHQGLNITTSEFNYFVSNIVVPALTSNGVPTADVTSCFAPPLTDPTFVASVVGQ